MSEPVYATELVASGTILDAVNVSGLDDEPLWVSVSEIAAVGVSGPNDSLVVLRSGMQLKAKLIHPSEIMSLIRDCVAKGNDE